MDPASPAEITGLIELKTIGVKRKLIADISSTVLEPIVFDDECESAEEMVFESGDI